MKYKLLTSLLMAAFLALAGCSAEIGSDQWCAEMKEKPKGEWSGNEATSFAKHCLLK